MLNYDKDIKNYFVSYNLSQKLSGKISNFFKTIDNGRFNEITGLSKTLDEWKIFFKETGFEIITFNKGLNSTAWKFYDIQTRPFLKILIKFFNSCPKLLRIFFKIMWMVFWYPILILFYFVFSNRIINFKKNCYYSFCLEKNI